ncbi:hypothetical protein DFP72DRAFT_918365 [Ephemerocybe angulata]|uniref:Uncharacterized protein n=1 Tax=Ephemerocybe angulata TaxID=980116 RepID=A0A8H6LYR4_9AGAR|nr:hypothetical protein DFP72DRAFT_918365 [Tulosesus angulatus]
MASLPADLHPFRFGDLPLDLVRTVFETSAETCNPSALSIACLSKEVKSWVEPILYRHIPINNPRTLSLLHRTITSDTSSKPASFFRTHVKSICIGDRWMDKVGQLLDILSACSNVTRLSTIGTIILVPSHMDDCRVGNHAVWERLRPTRLSISHNLFMPTHRHFRFTTGGPGPTPTCDLNPLFTNVTHLEISCLDLTLEEELAAHDVSDWSWPSLLLLTSLTHLCIAPRFITNTVGWADESIPWFPPSLVVCVLALPLCPGLIQVIDYYRFRGGAKENILRVGRRLDPRVVVAVSKASYNFYYDYYKEEMMDVPEGEWIKDEVVCRWDDERDRPGNEDTFWEDAASMVQRRKDAKL